MAFKIGDLERVIDEIKSKKNIREDIEDDFDAEPSLDVGNEYEQFADLPDDADSSEAEVPAEEADVEDAFELDPSKDGYDVSKHGRFVCCVAIMCNGESVDISEVIDPTKCTATISDVAVSGMAEEYKAKLESMGYSVNMEN